MGKKSGKSSVKQKKDLADQSLDDFLDRWDESEDDEGGEKHEIKKSKLIEKKAKKEKKKMDENSSGLDSEIKSQTKYIHTLKEKDPDFYEFLKENDEELLNFDESDEEEEGDGDEEGNVHQLPDRLEVASDESDYEVEEGEEEEEEGEGEGAAHMKKSSGKLTSAQIEKWRTEMDRQPTARLLADIVEAFRSAVAAIGAGEDGEAASVRYRVDGGTIFNSIVRLCVVGMHPALKTILKQGGDVESSSRPDKNNKRWKRVERVVRSYLTELCSLLARITEPSVAAVVLKHVHQMIPYFQAYPKGGKQILSRLITCWCQGEDTVRILALMCIVRLVRGSPLLEVAVKQMYLAYVKNCKFTSPNTLHQISFMRRSLVEVLGLDHNLAYYQAFVYIRQQAIHLRNAIVNSKKDSLQAVYNWQYIHSLELWGALLGHTASSDVLRPLIYPLVQVVIGTAKLVATPKYFPLRFHCCRILANISATTGTFIPVLPFYLDVLSSYNFSKKSQKVSMKPLDFSCILKLSKSQLTETGFKDATVEAVYGGLLTYLADNSNKIGFPELVTPLTFQLKEFIKNCKMPNYTRKMKQILDKVAVNQKFIETRRKTVSFRVSDAQNIQIWETQVALDGTPLLAAYRSWRKLADTSALKRHAKQEQDSKDYAHIPALKKNNKKIRMKQAMEEEVVGDLLDTDGEDSLDEEEMFKPKEERGKGKAGEQPDSKKRKKDSSEEEEEDSEEEKEKQKKKAKTGKEKKQEIGKVEEEEEDLDDDVEDLKLEDLDSGSDLEMADDFEADMKDEDDSGDDDDGDEDEADDDDDNSDNDDDDDDDSDSS